MPPERARKRTAASGAKLDEAITRHDLILDLFETVLSESTAAGDTPPLLDWRGRVVQDDAWAGEVDVSSPPAQRAAGGVDVSWRSERSLVLWALSFGVELGGERSVAG